MDRSGLHGNLMARPGQRDALAQYLLEGARLLNAMPECKLYIVSVSPADPGQRVWT